MKTLFLECGMGAAGDMLASALLELCRDKEKVLHDLNAAGIPGVRISAENCVKCGITGTRFRALVDGCEERSEDVHEHAHGHDCEHENIHDHFHKHGHERVHEHDHEHSTLGGILEMIGSLKVSDKVKNDAANVYRILAEAEGAVHGRAAGDIHFHEVGTADAIADIVAVSMLMEHISPDRVLASPVHVGSGKVRCAHGILPVPAPATALILQDVPIYSLGIQGELCTPTGAALLKYFVQSFGSMPVMSVKSIGYGMGAKDFEAANCLRAFLGETGDEGGRVAELCCNLDDMTPEAIGYAQELLFENGALDVYTIPAGMKKGRPGVQLWCMCREADVERMKSLIFRHTSTWGIRLYEPKRFVLERRTETMETEYGPVRVKSAEFNGVSKSKAEYEDIARISREQGVSLSEAKYLLSIE